ncbi:MAG: MASE3 domain-containing protein, partial [Desulfocucumaceae bacterium]
VGFIDLFHLYAYEGMPVIFSTSCPNRAILYHIIGRTLMAVTFLFGLFIYDRELRIGGRLRLLLLAASLGLVVVVLGTVSFNPQMYPAMYIKGQGLTQFKIYSEYFIIVLLSLAALGYMYLYKKNTEPILELIILTLVLSVFSELCFTFYKDVYAITNLLGHLFRFASYLLIYLAFFTNNVKKPYIELCRAREKLYNTNMVLEEKVQERTQELEKAMEKLSLAAFYDGLTGAANWTEFSHRFAELLNNGGDD